MKKMLFVALSFLFFETNLHARIIFEPYYSVSSTKSIKANRKSSTETTKISQREEKGLKAGLKFYRIFSLMLSVGQSFHTTTSTESTIKDEYEELDFASDFETSTTGQELKKKETQNRAKISFIFDPGFWIFIMRMKVGVTAKQRIVKLYSDDVLQSTSEPDPDYKPHAGLGLGIKISPRMSFIVDYSAYFYKFPDQKPFEREVSVSYRFSI